MSTVLIPHEQQGSGKFQSFDPVDQEGVYNAVCVEVNDLGVVPDKFKPEGQEKVEFYFELDRVDPRTNTRFVVKTQQYPKKLNAGPTHESGLHKFLVSWRGRGFTGADFSTPGSYTVETTDADGKSVQQERQGSGFELESMIGQQAQLQVINKVSQGKGRKYTMIQNIMPRTDGGTLEIEGITYVRPQAVAKNEPKVSSPAQVESDYTPNTWSDPNDDELPY